MENHNELQQSDAGVSFQIPLNSDPAESKATLCVYDGEALLIPEQVSQLLGINATFKQVKGSASGKSRRPALCNSWLLSSEGSVRSKDLNEHVEWILDRISHGHSAIRELKLNGHRVEFHITVKIGHWNTMCTISPINLQRLSNFGLPTMIDIYDYQGLD
jgi:hypothetical protein